MPGLHFSAASLADLVLGAFPGRLWQVAGVAALLSFATVATIAALHRLLGLLAFPLSTLLLLQLGIATSGGPTLAWRLRPASAARPAS
ncbi:hypothetical protein [Streptomyces sp. NPDC002078]